MKVFEFSHLPHGCTKSTVKRILKIRIRVLFVRSIKAKKKKKKNTRKKPRK